MKLRITDPTAILVDTDVRSVRAEDASGSFGILSGHADFLTVLGVSIVSWREMPAMPAEVPPGLTRMRCVAPKSPPARILLPLSWVVLIPGFPSR